MVWLQRTMHVLAVMKTSVFFCFFVLQWCRVCDLITANRSCCDEPPPDFRLIQPPPGLPDVDYTLCPAYSTGSSLPTSLLTTKASHFSAHISGRDTRRNLDQLQTPMLRLYTILPIALPPEPGEAAAWTGDHTELTSHQSHSSSVAINQLSSKLLTATSLSVATRDTADGHREDTEFGTVSLSVAGTAEVSPEPVLNDNSLDYVIRTVLVLVIVLLILLIFIIAFLFVRKTLQLSRVWPSTAMSSSSSRQYGVFRLREWLQAACHRHALTSSFIPMQNRSTAQLE